MKDCWNGNIDKNNKQTGRSLLSVYQDSILSLKVQQDPAGNGEKWFAEEKYFADS